MADHAGQYWISPFNADDYVRMLEKLHSDPLRIYVPLDKAKVVIVIPLWANVRNVITPKLSHIVQVTYTGYLIDNRNYIPAYSARELGETAYRLVEVLLNTEQRRTVNPLHLVINMKEGEQHLNQTEFKTF